MKTKFVHCPECGGAGLLGVHGNDFDSAKECSCCKGTGAIEVPMTNADCIRSMSDEELAEHNIHPFKVWNRYEGYYDDAYRCTGGFLTDDYEVAFASELEWLKMPAEVE